jgi:hypothetical protein
VAVEQQQLELVPASQARPQALHWGWEPQQNSERQRRLANQPEAAPQELHCYLDLHSAPAHPPERAQA